jgi:hypothetical protein
VEGASAGVGASTRRYKSNIISGSSRHTCASTGLHRRLDDHSNGALLVFWIPAMRHWYSGILE